MNTLMAQNLKTYQIWHHRRLLQGHLRKPFEELAFITKSLTPREMVEQQEDSDSESEKDTKPNKPVDTKNYHTWAYRQWLLAEFNSPELWAGELEFVEMMLRHDVRNNSAWHHRFFVVWESGVREGETDREAVLRREIDFVKEKLSYVANNGSAWNYLRGVLNKTGTPFNSVETFVVPFTAASTVDSSGLIDLENPLPSPTSQLPAPLAIEFLADIELEKAGSASGPSTRVSAINSAVQLFGSLASTHDTIRRKYWEYRQSRAKNVSGTALKAS